MRKIKRNMRLKDIVKKINDSDNTVLEDPINIEEFELNNSDVVDDETILEIRIDKISSEIQFLSGLLDSDDLEYSNELVKKIGKLTRKYSLIIKEGV